MTKILNKPEKFEAGENISSIRVFSFVSVNLLSYHRVEDLKNSTSST
jgi:hypothetical protein